MMDDIEWLLFLFMVGSTVWVYFDAKRIGVRRGQISGLGDMGHVGWAVACFGIWIIAFPLYLSKRARYKAINARNP